MRQLFLIPGTVLWFDPCAHLKEKYNHLNSLICQYYFCILHFVRGYVSCALSDRNSKASKKLPSLLRGLRHLLQILVQGHRVILFLKGNTQKRIYPPYFFKSLLFDILTQNPALICLTNSLLWKLHSHPSVLPICTNWRDDNN